MSVRIYVDTTVLIYARDSRFPAKQHQAAAWLRAMARASVMTIGVQVLKEFHSVASRKLALDPRVAAKATRDLFVWCERGIDKSDIERALDIQRRYKTSWWDALNLSAAAADGCSHFLTEDRQSAPVIEGVAIIDLFTNDPTTLLT